ncbi:Ser/Thr kinase [Mollivirus sibericum]|uniref:Ser/Thr kinase n=1 Tax=Mollivirus sibericum TaxID=1678078 RepID=UPI0006B2DC19|nr:Ser/Thr kinase [Mollivirus sibericum]ALD62200.1 Ser/Thr kinase [Mollivirus sibericum]
MGRTKQQSTSDSKHHDHGHRRRRREEVPSKKTREKKHRSHRRKSGRGDDNDDDGNLTIILLETFEHPCQCKNCRRQHGRHLDDRRGKSKRSQRIKDEAVPCKHEKKKKRRRRSERSSSASSEASSVSDGSGDDTNPSEAVFVDVSLNDHSSQSATPLDEGSGQQNASVESLASVLNISDPTEAQTFRDILLARGYTLTVPLDSGYESAVWLGTWKRPGVAATRISDGDVGSVIVKVVKDTTLFRGELMAAIHIKHAHVSPLAEWFTMDHPRPCFVFVFRHVPGSRDLDYILFDDGHNAEAERHEAILAKDATLRHLVPPLDVDAKTRLLDIETGMKLFVQMVQTVCYLHEVLGVAHRDIKPANVVVSPDLRHAWLIDFGFCFFTQRPPPMPQFVPATFRRRHPLDGRHHKRTSVFLPPPQADASEMAVIEERLDTPNSLHSGIMIVGTKAYLPPEVAATALYHPDPDLYRADVFSLGVLLYEMLFGTFAFTRHKRSNLGAYAKKVKYLLDRGQASRLLVAEDKFMDEVAKDIETDVGPNLDRMAQQQGEQGRLLAALVRSMLAARACDRPTMRQVMSHEALRPYITPGFH